jgi:hypothetical protein
MNSDHESAISGHELRGHKISVAMAEKSAPRAPQANNYGYAYRLILAYGVDCD